MSAATVDAKTHDTLLLQSQCKAIAAQIAQLQSEGMKLQVCERHRCVYTYITHTPLPAAVQAETSRLLTQSRVADMIVLWRHGISVLEGQVAADDGATRESLAATAAALHASVCTRIHEGMHVPSKLAHVRAAAAQNVAALQAAKARKQAQDAAAAEAERDLQAVHVECERLIKEREAVAKRTTDFEAKLAAVKETHAQEDARVHTLQERIHELEGQNSTMRARNTQLELELAQLTVSLETAKQRKAAAAAATQPPPPRPIASGVAAATTSSRPMVGGASKMAAYAAPRPSFLGSAAAPPLSSTSAAPRPFAASSTRPALIQQQPAVRPSAAGPPGAGARPVAPARPSAASHNARSSSVMSDDFDLDLMDV